MDGKTTVFLVDDHKLLRNTLRMFLESRKEIEVVGEADSGAGAVEGVLCLKPDIVLLDITLPDIDGVAVASQLISALPTIKIIAVTMHPEKLYLLKFLEVGGVGYVHKSVAGEELLQAIEQVKRGDIFLSPEGVQVMAGRFRTQEVEQPDPSEKDNADISPDVLSPRERQVLGLLSHGFSCREIGERLFFATSTVETYKQRLTRKLNLSSRKDLIEYAIHHKIYEDL